jgi:hypothetical protein
VRNITGSVALGEDFFNRKSEIARFWRDLDSDNLLLLAPRRVGKTSLMRKMAEEAHGKGFNPVFADVSDCADELAFVQRLYATILEHESANLLWKQITNSALGKVIGRVQKAGGVGFSIEFQSGSPAWTRLGEELADALSKLEDRWLIQIDELPVFVLKLLNHGATPQRERVREFLYWLRRLRLQYTSVRWMLAGSIGLDTVTTRLNIADSINDLRIVTLGAFDSDAADAMLQVLATTHRLPLSGEVRSYIIAKAGWPAPYYLQLIFHQLRDSNHPLTTADVDKAIEDLLRPSHKNYFDYWRQRLTEELGQPDAGYAITVLNAACQDSAGVSRDLLSQRLAASIQDAGDRDEKLRYILDILQNDGYLVEAQERWHFQFPLLREYWRRRVAPPSGRPE